MTELKSSTQALLELGRSGDDPTDAAIGKNRRALAERLGVGALAASAALSTTSKASAAVSAGTWSSAKAALIGGMVLVSGAALVGGAVAFRAAEPRSTETRERERARPTLPAKGAPLESAAPAPVDSATAASSVRALPEPSSLKAAPEALTPGGPPSPASHHAPASRPASARSIKEELELVRGAQQALNRGEPRVALALLAEHAQKFPVGVLWQDREASRVFAVCRTGDAAAARALADAFIRRAPNSPFVDRVRGACREPSEANSR